MSSLESCVAVGSSKLATRIVTDNFVHHHSNLRAQDTQVLRGQFLSRDTELLQEEKGALYTIAIEKTRRARCKSRIPSRCLP